MSNGTSTTSGAESIARDTGPTATRMCFNRSRRWFTTRMTTATSPRFRARLEFQSRARGWALRSRITTGMDMWILLWPTTRCSNFSIAIKGMEVDFADYNNDGLPDMVITDLSNQMYALYKNGGDGSFSYDSFTSGLGRMTLPHSGWGVRLFDFDNDGWKDLLVAQGHDLDTVELNYPNLHYRETMLLARNAGKGFVDVSAESGGVFREAFVGRGLAIGDIDNDGRLDAVVTSNDGPIHILHNETPTQNHWLTLK